MLECITIVEVEEEEEEEEVEVECKSSFKVDVNEMPVQSIHDDISKEHAINGGGLLTLFEMNTIVIKYLNNQITNNISNLIVEVIILAYIRMNIYLVDFP